MALLPLTFGGVVALLLESAVHGDGGDGVGAEAAAAAADVADDVRRVGILVGLGAGPVVQREGRRRRRRRAVA